MDDREIASATFLFKIAVVEVCLLPVPREWVIARTGCGGSTDKKPDEDFDLVLRFHQRVGVSKFQIAGAGRLCGSSHRRVDRRVSVAPTVVIIQMTKNVMAQRMLPTS